MPKHHNVLYTLVVILVIIQIVSFVSLIGKVSKLNVEINNLRIEMNASDSNLSDLIENYQGINRNNFQEISLAIAQQEQSQADALKEITLLKSTSGDFSSVIEDSVKAVVSIGTDISAGTGFFVSSDGYVVTNQHVIEGARTISVFTYDKRIISASLVGYDTQRDLAVLKVEGNFDYLELTNSDDLQVGKKVIAIGNPLGLSFSVTEGIISALNREGPNGLNEYIQTDVPLNPGNSGGPLIDLTGKVVGVNNFKAGSAESIGFALESNAVKAKVNEIVKSEVIK
ncbi:MAG: trypsin-like peptidase domain-containing protein [Nanoarchaeota archaeon]